MYTDTDKAGDARTVPGAFDRGAGHALILVVERDPHIRALARHLLGEAGYEVDLCDDGLVALARARVLLPVIVVTEILVPKVDGLRVCRTLKCDPLTSDIPVLVMSILAAEERALAAGADVFMKKPFEEKRLIETVDRLLASRRRRLSPDPSETTPR